jgi:hypothetical protein
MINILIFFGIITLSFNVLRFIPGAIMVYFSKDKKYENFSAFQKLLNLLEAVIIVSTLTLLIIKYYN